MKANNVKRSMLGALLLLSELVVFMLIGYCLRFSVSELSLLAVVYFFLLYYAGHFNFTSVLIWHEVVELLRIHLLYFGICWALELYLGHNVLLRIAALTALMLLGSVVIERSFRLMSRKNLGIRVLVVGAGKSAEEMHILFHRNRFLYITPVAYVNMECVTGAPVSKVIAETAEIVEPKNMAAFVKSHRVDELYIADDLLGVDRMQEIIEEFRDVVPVIRAKPGVKTSLPYNTDVANFDEGLFTVVSDIRRDELAILVRKIADILVGVVGCLVLIPVTVLVKLGALISGDTAPIIFTQDRFGKDGKLIKIYKYRTMVPNAEQILEELMANDPKIREEYLTNKKLNPDPRVTPFGKILRKTSLDELPQLINILKGEMSLIGPRPYLPREKEDMGKQYDAIIKLKPGLTGIWQATGRNNIGFEERCKLDEYYYYNWSLSLDVIILVKTVKAVLLKDGAI